MHHQNEVATSAANTRPIWGAEAIGRVIGRTKRQTYHLLESGHLPARKIGDSWVANDASLLAAIFGEVAS